MHDRSWTNHPSLTYKQYPQDTWTSTCGTATQLQPDWALQLFMTENLSLRLWLANSRPADSNLAGRHLGDNWMSLFDEVNRTTTSAKGETTKPNTLVSLAVSRNSFHKKCEQNCDKGNPDGVQPAGVWLIIGNAKEVLTIVSKRPITMGYTWQLSVDSWSDLWLSVSSLLQIGGSWRSPVQGLLLDTCSAPTLYVWAWWFL